MTTLLHGPHAFQADGEAGFADVIVRLLAGSETRVGSLQAATALGRGCPGPVDDALDADRVPATA